MSIFDRFMKPADKVQPPIPADAPLIADKLLQEVSIDLSSPAVTRLPFEQLAELGGSAASIVGSFVQSGYLSKNLYIGSNPAGVVGELMKASNGSGYYSAIMQDGKIVGQMPLTPVNPALVAVDPVTLATLAMVQVINMKLDALMEMEKQILTFLEQDKESQIEGDLKTLMTIVKDYRFNWENPVFASTNHQLAADIKRSAEGNMIFYQKQVADIMKASQFFITGVQVSEKQNALKKKFTYYRMSLYIWSFAAFLEVMLQGNHPQGYIDQVMQDIRDRTDSYTEFYDSAVKNIKGTAGASIESQVLKGIGTAGKAVGGLLGSIPGIKNAPVDNWLSENGENAQKLGASLGDGALSHFESVADPGSAVFLDSLDRAGRLFNRPQRVLMDQDAMYLVSDM